MAGPAEFSVVDQATFRVAVSSETWSAPVPRVRKTDYPFRNARVCAEPGQFPPSATDTVGHLYAFPTLFLRPFIVYIYQFDHMESELSGFMIAKAAATDQTQGDCRRRPSTSAAAGWSDFGSPE